MPVTYKNRLTIEPKFLNTGLSKDDASATANGVVIDTHSVEMLANGPYAEGLLLAQVEGFTGAPTAASVKFRLEHSDDGATFTPVTASENVGAETLDFESTSPAVKTLAFRPQGLKRYLRVAVSALTLTGGTTPRAKLRAFLILDAPRFV